MDVCTEARTMITKILLRPYRHKPKWLRELQDRLGLERGVHILP